MRTESDWLEEKRTCIGAADWAAILGEDPFRGPLHVWVEKVMGYKDEGSGAMRMGKHLEPVIARMYEEKTKRMVLKDDEKDLQIERNPVYDWLGCTLDGETSGSKIHPDPWGTKDVWGPLEIKNTRGYVYINGKWRWVGAKKWVENPPKYNRIQLQAQMAVTRQGWGALCALVDGTDLVWVDQERNDRFVTACIPVLEKFWKLVKEKTPPKIDDMPRTLEVVKRMYPDETGEVIEFNAEQEKDALRWLQLRSECSAMEKEKKALEAKLRYDMADNTFARLSDGSGLSLKKSFRKGYTRVIEDSEFRTLRPCKKI